MQLKTIIKEANLNHIEASMMLVAVVFRCFVELIRKRHSILLRTRVVIVCVLLLFSQVFPDVYKDC